MGTGGEPSWWFGPPTLVAGLALGWYLAYRGGYVRGLLFASALGTAPEHHVPIPRGRVSRSGHPVHVVVLTGGSPSAKTSAIAAVSDRLSALGFRVMTSVTPQIPVPPSDRDLGTRERLIRSALALEDHLIAVALARDEPTVLLLDRGARDAAHFQSLRSLVDDRVVDSALCLRRVGLSLDEANARYDAVVHLKLANESESATAEETSSGAWRGHPACVVVASADAAAAAVAAAATDDASKKDGAPLAFESSPTGADAHTFASLASLERTGTADRLILDALGDDRVTGVDSGGGEASAARGGGDAARGAAFPSGGEARGAEAETWGETAPTARSARGVGARGAGMIGSNVHPKAKKPRRPGG